jgi:hypothetical protein
VLLFGLHKLLIHFVPSTIFYYATATLIFGAFALFILKIEKKEFQRLPVIGKYLGTNVA